MSRDGKIIVFTVGTWDMFHVGHLNILKNAKEYGDILVVGVKTDELVFQDKGHHPLLCYEDRAAVVGACRYVDVVVPIIESERDQLLEQMDVDIMVVGNDWWEKKVRGHDYMEENNKRVIYLPYTQGRSSTILRKALDKFYKEQKNTPEL